MEDILKFLFIVGIILIGIVKQVKKEKEKEVSKKTPTPTIPSYKDNKKEVFTPVTPTQSKRGKEYPHSSPVKASENVSHYHPISKSAPTSTIKENTTQDIKKSPDFDIHSVDEVRKAIIWSEILQRKY